MNSQDKDKDNLIYGLHLIFTLTEASRGNIQFLQQMMEQSEIDPESKTAFTDILVEIHQSNQKANKLAELALKGNRSLAPSGSHSVHDFMRHYIAAGLALPGLTYELVAMEQAYPCQFDTSSLGMIFDNVASNSMKAGANRLQITLTETDTYVEVAFKDNGDGLLRGTDPESLFHPGVSGATRGQGFGIGLYHVKQLVEEMRGKVSIDPHCTDGFRLVVELRK